MGQGVCIVKEALVNALFPTKTCFPGIPGKQYETVAALLALSECEVPLPDGAKVKIGALTVAVDGESLLVESTPTLYNWVVIAVDRDGRWDLKYGEQEPLLLDAALEDAFLRSMMK